MNIELREKDIKEAIYLYCLVKGYEPDYIEFIYKKDIFGGSVLKCKLLNVKDSEKYNLYKESEIQLKMKESVKNSVKRIVQEYKNKHC